MTPRALLISLLLLLVICGLGYLTEQVARLPSMVGGGMPLVAFSVFVLLVLAVNPVLARLGPRWPLRGGELAVVLALGTGVCIYTGSTYLRYLGALAAAPAHYVKTRVEWQGANVLAYVPGHAGFVAEGQLLRPIELAQRVAAEREADTVSGRLWRLSDEAGQRLWLNARAAPNDDAVKRHDLVELVNRALADPAFLADAPADTEPANERLARARWVLQEQLPHIFAPPPPGEGVLLNEGRYDQRIMDGILFGDSASARPSIKSVPWPAWWPVLRLWGGVMILLVLTAICLGVIVRPQWGDRERLPFPIVRFAELMLRREAGRGLPTVAYSGMFWIGFGAVLLHVVNGLNVWFPSFPSIPLTLNLSGLQTLLPETARVPQSRGIFLPQISLTAVAFAFLLPRSISLTLGIMNVVFLVVAAQLLRLGIDQNGGRHGASWVSLMSFGGMIGMFGVLLYTGRAYYSSVVLGGLGIGREPVPAPAMWAFRAVLLLIPLTVMHLTTSGLSPLLSAVSVGVVLLLWIVSARIVCETGLYRFGAGIAPFSIASAFFGPEYIGPTNLLILAMLSLLVAKDVWESPMIYMVTGLEVTKRAGVGERVVAPGLAAYAVIGLIVAAIATLTVQYHFGIVAQMDPLTESRSWWPMNAAASLATELSATGRLVPAVTAGDIDRLANISWHTWTFGWTAAGLVLFALFAMARLRLPWWPIHPMLIVLFGDWGVVTLGFSFFLGWLMTTVVVGIGGAAMYQRVVPLVCGVIAAGLIAALGWMVVGLSYFLQTGLLPPKYIAF